LKLSFSYIHSNIAIGIKVATILSATLAIYHQDLTILANEILQGELMNHILVLPFLLTYILYRKRRMLRGVIPFRTFSPKRGKIFANEIVGALLCLLAFLLYSYGSYTFQPLEHHMVSLPIFVAGCVLIIFNTQTLKVLVFPIAFLLFLTPPQLEIVYAAGSILSTLSSEAAYNILKATGLPVILSTQYEIPIIILRKPENMPLTFAIDLACAGIYSIIGFAIPAVFVAYITRGHVWRRATIFIIGFPLLYVLNVTRITALVLIGYQYGMETATQVFHLFGGLALISLGTFILLYVSERIWKIFTRKSKSISCPNCSQSSENERNFCPACGKILKYMNIKISKRDLGKIAALVTSASLILALKVPVFALTEGPAEVIIESPSGEQGTTQILPNIDQYTLNFIYRDKKFEEISQQDATLIYAYVPIDKQQATIWVTLEIAKSRSSLHTLEVCLISWPQKFGYQPLATELDSGDVALSQNPPITARFFAFKRSNMTQVILYWYGNAPFKIGSISEQKYIKISLNAFANQPKDVSQIENQLLPISKAIINYWRPIETWSGIAIAIAQQGKALLIINVTLLAMTLIYQGMKSRKEREKNLRIYNKLALEQEKIILKAAHQAAQKNKSTGNSIISHYQKLTGESIRLETLFKKLKEAEEIGLMKREIAGREDEPLLIWKSQMPSKTPESNK